MIYLPSQVEARELSKPSKAFWLWFWLKLTQPPRSLAKWCHWIRSVNSSACYTLCSSTVGLCSFQYSPSGFLVRRGRKLYLTVGPAMTQQTCLGRGMADKPPGNLDLSWQRSLQENPNQASLHPAKFFWSDCTLLALLMRSCLLRALLGHCR